jgi:hypothetical protein
MIRYSDAQINLVSSHPEHYGNVDGLVLHPNGDLALYNLATLLPPRQFVALQISHALHRLPSNSTNVNLFATSALVQIASIPATIVRGLSMTVIVNVSQPFLCAKPNFDIIACCFDGE